jgi:hypothetical protein
MLARATAGGTASAASADAVRCCRPHAGEGHQESKAPTRATACPRPPRAAPGRRLPRRP